MKIADIILEKWTPEKEVLNGNTKESSLTGHADNIEDFFKAVDRLPDTIEAIKVPISIAKFKTSSDHKIIKPKQGWREDVKKQVKDLVQAYQEQNEEVESFAINTYGLKATPTDRFYITLHTKETQQFTKDMGKGKYGSLD